MTADEKDMQEFEAAMHWNGFFSPQRSGWNGSNGYTSARDADRYAGWRMAREAAAEELQRLRAIEAALKKLIEATTLHHLNPFDLHGIAEYAQAKTEAQAALCAKIIFNAEVTGLGRNRSNDER